MNQCSEPVKPQQIPPKPEVQRSSSQTHFYKVNPEFSSNSGPKRSSSGILSLFKWFKKTSDKRIDFKTDLSSTSSSSQSSLDDHLDDQYPEYPENSSGILVSTLTRNQNNASVDSVFSTATVASFTYVPPANYNPFGDANAPIKLLAPGPDTHTHKKRMKQLEKIRELDKNITLRKKYKLFASETISKKINPDQVNDPGLHRDYSELSLPLLKKTNDDPNHLKVNSTPNIKNHRRTASDSSKNKKAGAYCHVKGKRKAPSPPKLKPITADSTLGRRLKRQAPPPPPTTNMQKIPDVVCNDSLKLEYGILKPAKDPNDDGKHHTPKKPITTTSISPRPWYKRALPSNRDSFIQNPKKDEPEDRKESKLSQVISRVMTSEKTHENRKSGISILTNISELDREAAMIIQNNQYLAQEPPSEMCKPPWSFESNQIGTPPPKKRGSARELISKFNALTGGATPKQINPTDNRPNRFSYHPNGVGADSEKRPGLVTPPMKRSIFKFEPNVNPVPENKFSQFKSIFEPKSPNIPKDPKPLEPIKENVVVVNFWTCQRCTLENPDSNIKCLVCGSWKSFVKPEKNFDEPEVQKEPDDLKIQEEPKIPEDKMEDPIRYIDNETTLARKFAENVFKAIEMQDTQNQGVQESAIKTSVTVIEPEVSLDEVRRIRLARFSQNYDIEAAQPEDPENVGPELPDVQPNKLITEEQQKLRQMLKEMKNALPKRSEPDVEGTKGAIPKIKPVIVDEILKPNVDNDVPKGSKVKKVSSGSQTQVKLTNHAPSTYDSVLLPVSVEEIQNSQLDKSTKVGSFTNGNFELIQAKDFVGISSTVAASNLHLYANCSPVVPEPAVIPIEEEQVLSKKLCDIEGIKDFKATLRQAVNNSSTLAINRLLRRLEMAIAGGQHIQAAQLARDLARLKVNCSVTKRQPIESSSPEKNITADMYVEDQVSHQGPIPIQVNPDMNVANLKQKITQEYEIPAHVQRWILDKQLITDDETTLKELNITYDGCPMFLYLVAPDADWEETLKRVNKNLLQTKLEPAREIVPEETIEEVTAEENSEKLWKCSTCTLYNAWDRPGCEACSTERPKMADCERQNYLQLINLDNTDLVPNSEPFECLICLVETPLGQGVVLRECLHTFCRECLAHTIQYNQEAQVKCPYRDRNYSCDIVLQEREIKALVTKEVYEHYLGLSMAQAETKIDNAFHCKTPDCQAWCIFEDNVNEFKCPVCKATNCLTCQAIHEGLNCKQYQEELNKNSETNNEARRTRDFLEDMVNRGEAMVCPTCQVVLMKKWGCDWLRCSMCKTEICWVTRGPRWGPAGKGDTSGGCQCGVNGIKCHPKCTYCH